MDQAHTLTLAQMPAADVNHEGLIARHMARHALMIAPAVVVVAGLVRGVHGGISAAIGLALCAANFLISAQILSWAARRSVSAIYGAIFGGFVLRLAFLTGIVLALKPVSFIDIPVLVITLAVAHVALLAWTRTIITPRVQATSNSRALGRRGAPRIRAAPRC